MLSFSQIDKNSATQSPNLAKLLGDVVICPEVASENVSHEDKSLDEELVFLIIHGILHLLGYDHVDQNDAILMQNKEQEILALVSQT